MPKVVGTPKHLKVAREIAESSITLLKNSDKLLPVAKSSGKKVLVTGFGVTATKIIGEQVAERGLHSEVVQTGFDPGGDAIKDAVNEANRNDLVIVTTFNAWSAEGQKELVDDLLGTGKPVIVAALGTPYDVAYFPTATTFITSYDYQPVSLVPLVKVLFGELQPTGRLPVTITEPPPSKKVLYPFGFHTGLS